MRQTTAQAMTAFLADISVTDYQKTSIIEGRKTTVVANLTEAFPDTSDLPFSRALLMGSAAKGTIVRPIDDVDVLAVFSNENKAWDKYRWDSKGFIYRVRQAYNGLEAAQVGTRGQAVRVFFQTGGHVDVAPVFSYGDDVYALPNGEGGWISTAPTKANAWFADRNSTLNYHLAPIVRLLKKWNAAHSKRMQSFHLETVAGTMFESLGTNYRDALARFFEWAPNWLDVADPGGQSGSLSSYLSWNARPELMTALKAAADRAAKALEAEAAGNHDEAKRLWKIILGASFPG
jgi:hypothetical protein